LAQGGLAALLQTPPRQVLAAYLPLLRGLQQQQGAIFQTVILAVRQVRQQHFLVAIQTHLLKRVVVAVGLALLAVLVLVMVPMLLVATVVLGRFGP
jgi:hypothetical protein